MNTYRWSLLTLAMCTQSVDRAADGTAVFPSRNFRLYILLPL